MLILIRGAGDLASGTAIKLVRCGYQVVMTDLPQPTTVRCQVAFSRATYQYECKVEDTTAVFAEGREAVRDILSAGQIPVVLYNNCSLLHGLHPDVVVDAILAKRNTGTTIHDAAIVIALGPGFTAGEDCHAVIETMRGHDLGRVLYSGGAIPNTGKPGIIEGLSVERILRAPCDGIITPCKQIGQSVEKGEVLAAVSGQPIIAHAAGVIRGILPGGTPVHKGMKSGDVDPRGIPSYCYTVSDKARCIAGGVLEAILHFSQA